MAANSVPAAAVIQRPQILSGFTGRKAFRRCLPKLSLKYQGSTLKTGLILGGLKGIGAIGTVGVGVKSVDIMGNTESEGNSLARF